MRFGIEIHGSRGVNELVGGVSVFKAGIMRYPMINATKAGFSSMGLLRTHAVAEEAPVETRQEGIVGGEIRRCLLL